MLKNLCSKLFIGALLFSSLAGYSAEKRLLIIDDDIGMDRDGVFKSGSYLAPWFRFTDPDGGLELIYAVNDPSAEVLGVTVMMGVAPMDVCVGAAKKVLKAIGRSDIPVFSGAKSSSDLGRETEAARFIIDTVMQNPGQVEIVATGPLTNIATALMLEPNLPKYWKTLHVATGDFRGALGYSSNIYKWSRAGLNADINVDLDVPSLRYVMDHGGNFPIYPNEVADDVPLTRGDYADLKSFGTVQTDFLAYELAPLHNFYNRLGGAFFAGAPTHAVVPIAIVLDPDMSVETKVVAVELSNYKRHGKPKFSFKVIEGTDEQSHKVFLHLDEDNLKQVHQKLIDRMMR